MRPIRWFTSSAAALRGFVSRAHRRAEGLPGLPFGIALALAAVALLIAVEHDPRIDERITDVEELSLPDSSALYEAYQESPAQLQVVEYGFGTVLDPDGTERMSLGAVLYNPHESPLLPGALTITAENETGDRIMMEEIFVGPIPGRTKVPVGYVLLGRADAIDMESLRMEAAESYVWEFGDSLTAEQEELLGMQDVVLPKVSLVGTEPLFSPEGHRLVYKVESGEDVPLTELKVQVIFRDAEGGIVGGMPGWGDPFGRDAEAFLYRQLPPGVFYQHLDLPLERIPEGADLSKIEIGPGT